MEPTAIGARIFQRLGSRRLIQVVGSGSRLLEGYLPVGYVCLLALQLVPAVRSTRTTPPDAMQALGFEDGLFFP